MFTAIVGYGYWGQRMHQIISNNKYSVDCIISTKSNKYLEEIFQDKKICEKNRPALVADIEELKYNVKLKYSTNIRFFICTGPALSIITLNNIIGILSCPQLSSCRFLVEKPAAFDTKKMKQLVELVKNHNERIYFNYPYIHSNLNSIFSAGENNFSICKVCIYSKRRYSRPHEKLLDYIPHFISIIDIIYGKDLVGKLISSSEIISITSDGEINTITMASDNHILTYEYGESFSHSNSIHLSSEDQKNSITLDLNDLFESPIDKNIKRFLSSDPIINDDLIHDLLYELASQSIVQAMKDYVAKTDSRRDDKR